MPFNTRSFGNPLNPTLHDLESLLRPSQDQSYNQTADPAQSPPNPLAEGISGNLEASGVSSESLEQAFQALSTQSPSQKPNMIDASATSTSGEDDWEQFDDLMTDWIDLTFYAGRQISVFRERVKSLSRPPVLFGSRDYRSWRDSMLMYAEQVGIKRLLSSITIRPTSGARAQVWKECNKWLFTFLNTDVSLAARSNFTQPNEHIASELLPILDSNFLKQPKTSRRRLIQELCSLGRPREASGDRMYSHVAWTTTHPY